MHNSDMFVTLGMKVVWNDQLILEANYQKEEET